jgi:copper homeostasis protein
LSGKVDIGSQMEYRECIKRMNTPMSEFVLERADYDLIKRARGIIDNIELKIINSKY